MQSPQPSQHDRTAVILNPRAGSGSASRRWPELASRLGATVGPFERRDTGRPGDAARLARALVEEGYSRIIAVGGDGTFSEALDGVMGDNGKARREDILLGLLPFGTGGDFRKTLGMSTIDDALGALATGGRLPIDVGRVSYIDHHDQPASRYFLNVGGFGVGGLVDAYVNDTPSKMKERLGGKLTFMLATARAYVTYRNRRVRISLDGRPAEERVINHVAIANGQYFGGGMWIAPQADLTDGLFDVVTLGDLSVLTLIRHSGKIYKGAHLGLEGVSLQRVRKLVAEPVDEPVLLEIDGEQPGRLPATFELFPGAVKLAVPRRIMDRAMAARAGR
jgi:YegS/Rv2252/BmrU family lipid kinase